MAEDPWWQSALCAQTDPDAFFMSSGTHGDLAKSICARCEVRVQCLAEELSYSDQGGGIFAGLGLHARRRLQVAVARGADPFEVAIRAVERAS